MAGEKNAEFMERVREWAKERRRRRLTRTGKLGAGRVQLGLVSSLLVLTVAVVWSLDYLSPAPAGDEIQLTQLQGLIDANRVETAIFNDEDAQLVGTFTAEPVVEAAEPEPTPVATEPAAEGEAAAEQPEPVVTPEPAPTSDALQDAVVQNRIDSAPDGSGQFWVAYPASDAATADLIDSLRDSGASVEVDPQSAKGVVRLILTVLLPLMILANLFAIFLTWSRGGSSGLGEVQNFSQVGDKRVKGNQTTLGFHDVAGIPEAVVELKEVVDYLTNPDRYDELGAAPPKGVLLFGPPGVGKTLLAKAVAGEAGVPFFSVAGAEFVESLVGVGAARVRDLFARVRAVAPAIVFIDELDAAGRRRGAGGSGGGSDEREQTLNQLLVEMDGFEIESGIVVMAATNRPDIIDPALLRPGRFDRHITIEKPDVEARQAILELHAKKRKRVSTVDFADIARRTPGFSGADLANVVNEAALLAIRENKPQVTEVEFNEAIARVMTGPKRRGHLMSEDERRRIATHEAGHAIAAAALGKADDVHRISLVARGKGLAATAIGSDDDAVVLSRGQLKAQMVIALAGTASEELFFDEPSTGGEDDLERVTNLAKEMVGKFGMSKLGKIRLLAPEAEQFLASSEALGDISQGMHEAFDLAVREVVDDAYAASRQLLEIHKDAIERLVVELLEHETIDQAQLRPLLPAASTNGNGHAAKKPAAKKATARKTATKKKTTAKKTTKKAASKN